MYYNSDMVTSSSGLDFNTAMTIFKTYAAVGGVLGLVMLVSTWKVYKKAGKPGWASIVPIYNIIVLLQICDLPLWYLALLFLPFANIYVLFKMYIELAHKFGKSTGFGIALIFFSFVFD